jgi:Protein of unknown function (DUF295)
MRYLEEAPVSLKYICLKNWVNPKDLTISFKVYMFEELVSFKELNELEGDALFLGPSCSMSVTAKSSVFAHWFRPNCVYFLADRHLSLESQSVVTNGTLASSAWRRTIPWRDLI